MSDQVINSLVSLAAIAGLWIFFFWLYRDYRLDKFRESLFSLRDELYDLGLNEKIGFDHLSYGMLRSLINGSIQFGHRLGLFGILTFVLIRRKEERFTKISFDEMWKESLATLPEDVQDELNTLRGRFHFLLLEQVVFTSLLLVGTLISVVIVSLLKHLSRNASRYVTRLVPCSVVDDLTDRYDSAAFSLGS